MTTIRLFPGASAPKTTTTSSELLQDADQRLSPKCDKTLVLMIEDIGAGRWQTHWSTNMSNPEALVALEVIRDLILSTVLGRK